MARPAQAKLATAYDLGRRGEPPPEFVQVDDDLLDAYHRGVDDLDQAGGEKPTPTKPTGSRPHRAAGRPPGNGAAGGSRPSSPRARPAASGKSSGRPSTGKASTSSRARRVAQAADTITPQVSAPRPSLNPSDGAGFALGLVLYALTLSYLREGPAGPKRWLAAKFVNRVQPK